MTDQVRMTTSFPHPSGDQVGNRSRLDSGTSGSSESSRGSGKPPRRRSHRPRGCRGGSNRRRNNSGDNTKKKGISNGGDKEGAGAKPRPSKKTILAKQLKGGNAMYHQGNGFPMNDMPKYGVQPSGNNTGFYIDVGSHNPYQGDDSFASMGTVPTADLSSSNGSYGTSNYGHFVDYPAIQPSLSDSSSENGMGPGHGAGAPYHGRKILPPLPSNSFPREPLPTGPNPYALNGTTTNTHQQDFVPQQRQQQPKHMQDTRFMGGGYPVPMKCSTNTMHTQHQLHNQHHSQPLAPLSLFHSGAPKNISVDESDYRAERLEKQRQTVVGGSLFATSPRSFLMGRRNGHFVVETA